MAHARFDRWRRSGRGSPRLLEEERGACSRGVGDGRASEPEPRKRERGEARALDHTGAVRGRADEVHDRSARARPLDQRRRRCVPACLPRRARDGHGTRRQGPRRRGYTVCSFEMPAADQSTPDRKASWVFVADDDSDDAVLIAVLFGAYDWASIEPKLPAKEPCTRP
jgi:hypothetical protein